LICNFERRGIVHFGIRHSLIPYYGNFQFSVVEIHDQYRLIYILWELFIRPTSCVGWLLPALPQFLPAPP